MDVFFFQVDRDFFTADQLSREYEDRELIPDVYAQAAVNANDPTFADAHPNAALWLYTPWFGGDLKIWGSIRFARFRGERYVDVDPVLLASGRGWCFGGVRQ